MKMPLARLRDRPQPVEVSVDAATYEMRLGATVLGITAPWEVPTTGTVYGVALNYRSALDALGEAIHAAPYKAPPKAPILYIKPRNTWIGHGAPVRLATDVAEVAIGPTLGIVFGRAATRVSAEQAFDFVAGYTVVNDLSVPHTSYYRPALRQQCQDGFCPIGPAIIPRRDVRSPDSLGVRAFVNGELRLSANLAELIRPINTLIRDITEFMTLAEGDVLRVGLPAPLPRGRAGDVVSVEIEGIGRLENPLVTAAATTQGPQS